MAEWLRREQAEGCPGGMLRVLEVGAGDGRLAYHLRASLVGVPVELRATDSFVRGLAAAPGAEVRCADYRAALAEEEWHPDVVLCCWMPLGQVRKKTCFDVAGDVMRLPRLAGLDGSDQGLQRCARLRLGWGG